MNFPAGPPEPLLQVRDLAVDLLPEDGGNHAPRPLLSGIAFEMGRGEIAGLFGESGCGKTTLAHALLQLLPRSRFRVRGSVRFRGKELLPLDERALQPIRGGGMALIPQDPLLALNPVLRAGRQVAEVVRAHRLASRRNLLAAVESLFQLAGLGDSPRLRNAYPHQLSGGERQRLLIAQALAGRPSLVIADEPFTALDPIRVVEVLSLLRSLRDALGTSFLVISHDPGVLARIAESVLVIDRGRIVERGAAHQVFRAPAHPYTAGLLRYAV
jgi:peptide/nickel transport system ATP-binding protein